MEPSTDSLMSGSSSFIRLDSSSMLSSSSGSLPDPVTFNISCNFFDEEWGNGTLQLNWFALVKEIMAAPHYLL